MFNSSDDNAKKAYSDTLSAMIYIAHVLPRAGRSPFLELCIKLGYHHLNWPLNGWNDEIIQPARDAVLEYYKVST